MEPNRKRRSVRFSLRTLFVLVTLVAVWLGLSFNWIKKRHEFLRSGRAMAVYRPNGQLTRAPGLLWVFGEEGYQSVQVFGDGKFVEVARRLFPEAGVVDKYVLFKPFFEKE